MENEIINPPSVANAPTANSEGPKNEFECLCCRQLMVDPTTLNCGHSFCRLCLAEWYLSSNKAQCLMCQQEFNTLPNVSIILRNLIENQHGEEIRNRYAEIKTHENITIISNFEESLNSQLTNSNQVTERYKLCGLLLCFVCFVTAIWPLVASFSQKQEDKLIYKPVSRWTVLEVQDWLETLHPKIHLRLSQIFLELNIDGEELEALYEDPQMLDKVTMSLNRSVRNSFKASLKEIIEHGVKPPQDVWEYKEVHLFKVACMCYLCPVYPRLVLVGMYFVDYRGLFLPLIHQISPVLTNIGSVNLYTYEFPALTSSQWLDLSWKVILLPHFSIYMEFVLKQISNTNIYVAVYLMWECMVLTFLQLYQYWECYLNGARYSLIQVKSSMKSAMSTALTISIAYFCSFLGPKILGNIVFYFLTLFCSFSRILFLASPNKFFLIL